MALQVQAQCNASAGFGWANNSLQQDPCTVASFLGGVCSPTGTSLLIPALEQHQIYTGPPQNESQNSCLCSSVYYSLLMCCSLCQNRDVSSWTAFNANCTPVYIGYQHPIPAGTRVPAWAYENVTLYNGFNATVAQQELNLPESAPPVSSPTVAPPASSDSSHKSNAGAIAGGTIGGIVFLALVAGAIFLFIRRRRSVVSPSKDGPSPTFYAPSTIYTPPKLYDPSDPSTFPPSSTGTPFHTSIDQSDTGIPPTRHYTGAAEI